MGDLQVKKLNVEPTAPYEPNTMYAIREPVVVPAAIGWRIYITEAGSGGANLPMLGGVDFMEAGSGGTAFGTSYQSTHSPSKVFDGDGATYWNGDAAAVGSYVGMIYATASAVENVTITAANVNVAYMPQGFKVQYSHDTTDGTDGTWVDLYTATGLAAWTGGEARAFSMSTLGDTVKIWISSSDGNTVSKSLNADQSALMIAAGEHAITTDTIATRDALSAQTNFFVLVEDPSADPGAGAIPTMYLWIHSQSEYVRLGGSHATTVGTTEW